MVSDKGTKGQRDKGGIPLSWALALFFLILGVTKAKEGGIPLVNAPFAPGR